MGRRAPRSDDRGMRRRGPRRAEGIREARHPSRSRARTISGRMFDDVYAEVPWHIAEQREQALDEGRD